MAALTQPVEVLASPEPNGLPAIDGYAIEKRLGRGAGGEVFRGVRLGSDRQLAIKLLRFQLGEGPQAKRAWRELDLLQQLHLPCMPRLIDSGVHDGRLFIATEFIEGHALDEHCGQNELDVAARVELLVRTAEAVQSINEVGIIHRDIKPSNIIVDTSSRPMLIDLGIATLLGGDPVETLTEEGAPIGSPAFMPPEQARGERNRISTRSDVYSLGATAYVLLTGTTPHDMDATLHETIRRVAQDEPRRPRDLMPSLPRPLAAILSKACGRKPEDRYRTAAELADDLRRWLNHEPVEAGGMSLPQRVGRFVARHPITTTAAACLAIAVLTFASTWAAVWWTNRRPHHVELAGDGREARLVSMSGNTLHTWNEPEEGGLSYAGMLDRPAVFGGGHIAAVAFNFTAESKWAGRLCLYELDNLESPFWMSPISKPELAMPDPISYVGEDTDNARFLVTRVDVADVFADSPGDELIVIHRNSSFSPNAIRVYSMDGEVLYQVWHDGVIMNSRWLPEAGLLVLCGLNGEGPITRRDAKIGQDVGGQPVVVFALRPEFGNKSQEWIRTAGGGGTFEPAWYRCLRPLEAVHQLNIAGNIETELGGPSRFDAAGSHFRFSVIIDTDPTTIALNFMIDATGAELKNSRLPGDSYRQRTDLPHWDDFEIGEIPPLRPSDS